MTGGVELRNVCKRFGDLDIIHGVDLDIPDGAFVVFVGPSGCGKSTLLRMIAGLEEVSDGEIHIKGRDVTDVDPSERGIAMVFQSYALYPHMTVRDNLAFGLKMQRTERAKIDARVATAAEILKIGPLLDRRPGQLSGGQRQRVAIGRAIVRKPDIFLFDEPLSNLDAELRVSMRVEIAQLHRELGNTMIYVTHDQTEAMTLADIIVVLRDGRVEQMGAPRDVYEKPDNVFVAGFIGSPRMNLLSAEGIAADRLRLAGREVAVPRLATLPAGKVTLGIRPEHLVVADPESASLKARVDVIEDLGGTCYLHCQLEDGQRLVAEHRDAGDVRRGEVIGLDCPPTRRFVFGTDGHRLPTDSFHHRTSLR